MNFVQDTSMPAFMRAIACRFHSIAAICACLSVPIMKVPETRYNPLYYNQERKTRAEGDQGVPETRMTCGTILCPSAPPPPPTLSSNTSAAQVVLVAMPRATRTMHRFVMGEKYLTLFGASQKKKEKDQSLAERKTGAGEGRGRAHLRATHRLLPSRHLQSSTARSASAHCKCLYWITRPVMM